jgi:hypothetical protein
MFEAYFKALLARNRLITETMIQNQQILAELFSRHLDFGAEFLQHQMRVVTIVTQWRNHSPCEETAADPVEMPKLKVVQTRR